MSIAACTFSGIFSSSGPFAIACCIHVSPPSTTPIASGCVGFRPRFLNSSALSKG